MATLTGKQLKDSYQSLVTIGDSITSNPTSGRLENGKGTALTAVGIGTDSPATNLHISSTSSTPAVRIESTHPSGIPFVDLKGASSSQIRYIDETGTIQTRMNFSDNGSISFVDVAGSGNARMKIDSSGNVGIGTTSPSAKLSVVDSPSASENVVLTSNSRDTGANSGFGDYTLFGSSTTSSFALYGRKFISGPGWLSSQISSGGFLFSTGALGSETERMRIDSDGLKFNGDTATANALDDYEEGTWTPTLEGASTAGTYTFSTNQSYYTKIGRQVTVISRLIVDTASSGVGGAKFGGLPFTKVTNTSFNGSVRFKNVDVDNSTINISAVPWTLSPSTDFSFSSTLDNADAVNLDIAGISTGDTIEFSFTYFV